MRAVECVSVCVYVGTEDHSHHKRNGFYFILFVFFSLLTIVMFCQQKEEISFLLYLFYNFFSFVAPMTSRPNPAFCRDTSSVQIASKLKQIMPQNRMETNLFMVFKKK
jgi:hypothetical protein